MNGRLGVACGIALITLLGFFQFPGHTYLQSDTQIYVPMLEHIADPSTYPGDLVATKPHLSYTIYDEVTLALHGLFGATFDTALVLQQALYRALQVFGIYLLATALPLSRPMALVVAALASLGATIAGPAVLLIEYEPVPRAFAIGFVFLALGLAARSRPFLGAVAASLGFLYHAPTTAPFWLCFLPWLVSKRQWRAFIPLGAAVALLLLAAHFQQGVVERQHFFFRLEPDFERLQRLRAPYNWVSLWDSSLITQYVFFWLASLSAFWRVRPIAGRAFLLGLPIIGLLSVPSSYLLLEKLKWGFISQFQPARALLFVTAFAIVLGAAAALRAAQARRWPEAALWFTLVFIIPMQGVIANLDLRQWLVAAALAVACSLIPTRLVALPVLAAYFLIPWAGPVHNYPHLETPDLGQLEEFARAQTTPSSMFVFPQAGHSLYPGIFRVRAQRPVYVDWKSGGQVNYYRSLADDWWRRWLELHQLDNRSVDLPALAALGIDYAVVSASLPAGAEPVYRNASFAVYRLRSPK